MLPNDEPMSPTDGLYPDQRELSPLEFIEDLVKTGWPRDQAIAEWEAIQRGERD